MLKGFHLLILKPCQQERIMVSKGYCKAGTVVKVTFFFNKYNNWNKIEGGEDHSHLPAFKGGRVEARWNDSKLRYNPAFVLNMLL